MWYNPDKKKMYIHKDVGIMFIYHLFTNSGISESNIRHSMLALRKDNNNLI